MVRFSHTARWTCRLLVLLVAAVLALPAAAGAHAILQGTVPANGATVQDHPKQVVLTFNEDITVSFGGVKVFGPDGKRVDEGGATARDKTVTVKVDTSKDGTYAASFRIISADTHPVRGAFTFNVVKASAGNAAQKQALAESKGNRPQAIAFGIARGFVIAGVLIAVGGALFALFIAPSWRPRWIVWALVLAAIGALAAFVLDAAIAGGFGIGDALRGSVLREEARTTYGGASLWRALLAVVCAVVAWLAWRRPREAPRSLGARIAIGVPFLMLALTLSVAGHAIASKPVWLRVPADMLHVLAAAAWLGGLVQLIAYIRAGAVEAAAVRRFSRVALTSVIVLVVTGLYAAWKEIGLDQHALLDTTYGRLVLAKAILLVLIMPLARLNQAKNVPAISEDTSADGPRRRLRRYAAIEVAILLVVVALTAWLVETIPARVQNAPRLYDKTTTLPTGTRVQLTVDPAKAGPNKVHVYVFTKQLQPDGAVNALKISFTNKKRGIGPLDAGVTNAGPGHYTSSNVVLPFAGTWTAAVSLERGEFDEEHFTVKVPVNAAGAGG